MVIFSLGSAVVLSAIVLLIALLLDRTAVGAHVLQEMKVSLFTYTLVNLPQVLLDGLTIGFVYAAIALGYTMVYGVLQFINFAHSEIFATGAFVGVEILIALKAVGVLDAVSVTMDYVFLILAMLAGMAAAGGIAVLVERVAYRPLRSAPRLVPLISAIGVSFFLQELDPPDGEPDHRPIQSHIPDLWQLRLAHCNCQPADGRDDNPFGRFK